MPVVESGSRAWLLTALVGLGCGGPAPCARSSECPAPEVCGLSGQCASLAAPEGARFAGSAWLQASDWGIAGPSTQPLGDRLRVGGDAGDESLLTFGPLPAAGELLRAVLVLRRHDTAPPVAGPVALFVESVGPYRGGVLPTRGGVVADRFAAARRTLAAGPPRDVRIDITDAARDAANRDERAVYLLLRAHGDGAQYFASPQHSDGDRQPRLELMLH
ncbi:MAG: hypothetical protein AB8I08_39500 [Sandaracinaceae bacterium]